MRSIFIFILIALVGTVTSTASDSDIKVITEIIKYQADEAVLNGYLAYREDLTGKRPGILVIHEWWGHNEYARKRAYRLAELGYIALAVDMYGDGKLANHPSDAGKFMKEITSNMPLAEKRMQAAMHVLHEHELTDKDKTAAIGYCFGGAMVLHLARIGTDIDGVVSFHGSLGTQTPAKQNTVVAKVLVLHGEDDPFIPVDQVKAFKAEMDSADVDYEFIAYPNVKHSFTNPQADEFSQKFDLPALQYDRQADEDSWNRMQEFLNNLFE